MSTELVFERVLSPCVLPVIGVKLTVPLGSIEVNVVVLKALFVVSSGSGDGAWAANYLLRLLHI